MTITIASVTELMERAKGQNRPFVSKADIQALCADWLRQVGEAGALSAAIMRVALEEAETKLEKHEDRICRECEGRTYVPNRAARWSEDTCDGRHTGQYSTNDPEEIECPRCNGVGYEAPPKPKDAPRMPTIYDDNEEPF